MTAPTPSNTSLPFPPIGSKWRHTNRRRYKTRTYEVLRYLDRVVMADGHVLPQEILCRRVESKGTREVHVRLTAWHPIDGHLYPLEPPS